MRAELEKAAEDRLTSATARSAALADVVVQLTANASEEGNLYGSIGPREISEALEQMGHQVSKREVVMAEGPIRAIGEFEVQVQLHADVSVPIKVVVASE
jgi:large subunit ribosomal protein L9